MTHNIPTIAGAGGIKRGMFHKSQNVLPSLKQSERTISSDVAALNLSICVAVNVLVPRAIILLNKVVILQAFTFKHRITSFAVERNVALHNGHGTAMLYFSFQHRLYMSTSPSLSLDTRLCFARVVSLLCVLK